MVPFSRSSKRSLNLRRSYDRNAAPNTWAGGQVTSQQIVAILVNGGIYVILIAFVLYRQMTRQPLRPRRLVLLPAVLGLFALQQLSRQRLPTDFSTAAFLVVNVVVSLGLGLWRGTTFRVWTDAGLVVTKGTVATLVSWGVLIAIRIPFAFTSHVLTFQGLVIGELLLALAITFAAQNAVLWARASRFAAFPVEGGYGR